MIYSFVCLFICVPTTALTAGNCEGRMVKGIDFEHRSYNLALSPAWSDERILREFKIDIRAAKVTRSDGPDGFSIDYNYAGKMVRVLRSAVDGIVVLTNVKSTTIVWHLGSC